MKKIWLGLLMGVGVAMIAGCTKSSTTNNDPTSGNSSEAMVWSLQPGINNTSNDYITSLASSGSVFVAVGYSNLGESGQIFSSPDGITWTSRVADTIANLWNVIWGKNQFVAVGDSGKILTSPDGATWTVRSSGTTASLYTAICGANKYIAYGLDNMVATSSDGISWTVSTSNLAIFGGYNNGIAWGNNKFVRAGYDSIYTSPDGLKWTSSYQANIYTTNAFAPVIWADSQFVIAGSAIVTSPDGITWTIRGIWKSSYIGSAYSIAWGNGKFVIGQDYNNYTSVNGSTWNMEEGFPGTREIGYMLAYGGGKFVVVNGIGMVMTSPW